MNLDRTIYIDGVKHQCTALGEYIYVDHPQLPGRPCARHLLTSAGAEMIKSGGAVYTGGRTYSLDPPLSAEPPPPPVPWWRRFVRRTLVPWLLRF